MEKNVSYKNMLRLKKCCIKNRFNKEKKHKNIKHKFEIIFQFLISKANSTIIFVLSFDL